MRKIFLLSIIAGLFCSCATKIYHLTGKYDEITIIKSEKPFDSVWSNVIDLFATKGISIKVIDKSSGLIVSEKSSFINNYTFEINGKPDNKSAWIVLNYIQGGNPNMNVKLKPNKVTAEWNIRIKPDGKGSTINVNLTNIEAELQTLPAPYTPAKDYIYEGKSTGVFEKAISDKVK